jgi:hypothetical protein
MLKYTRIKFPSLTIDLRTCGHKHKGRRCCRERQHISAVYLIRFYSVRVLRRFRDVCSRRTESRTTGSIARQRDSRRNITIMTLSLAVSSSMMNLLSEQSRGRTGRVIPNNNHRRITVRTSHRWHNLPNLVYRVLDYPNS